MSSGDAPQHGAHGGDNRVMSDTVFVRDLRPRVIVGIEPWERKKRQELSIDIDLAWDIRKAAATDDIEHTVNYRAVSKAVQKHAEESAYYLVETLAERLVALIRDEFGVPWVRLRIHKVGAVRFSSSVGVEIERGTRPLRTDG